MTINKLCKFSVGAVPSIVLVPTVTLCALVVLGAALVWTSVTTVRQTEPQTPVGADVHSPIAPVQAADTGRDEVVAALAGSELFGHIDPSSDANAETDSVDTANQDPSADTAGAAPVELPPADLALVVQGVIFADKLSARRAIIAGVGPDPQLFRIGDHLPGDAVIRFIEARRVVVEEHGELKALNLTDLNLTTGTPTVVRDGVGAVPKRPLSRLKDRAFHSP